MTGILQKEEGRSSKTLSVRLRSGRCVRFAFFFLAPHTLFTDQQVRRKTTITLKLGPTSTIHSLKIILLQYF